MEAIRLVVIGKREPVLGFSSRWHYASTASTPSSPLTNILSWRCPVRRSTTRERTLPACGKAWRRFKSPHHFIPFFIHFNHSRCGSTVLLTTSMSIKDDSTSRVIRKRVPFASALHLVSSIRSCSSSSLKTTPVYFRGSTAEHWISLWPGTLVLLPWCGSCLVPFTPDCWHFQGPGFMAVPVLKDLVCWH